MFCRHCGTTLNEGAGFCPQCGSVAGGQPHDVPVAAPPSRGFPGAALAAVAAGVLLLAFGGGFAALYFAGTLEPLGLGPHASALARDGRSQGDDASDDAADQREESSGDDEATDADEPESSGDLTDGESYDALEYHYERLWTLHEYIGLANADGSYGGTGFAYEVFNSAIGSPDYDARVQLVSDCQFVLDTILESRTELENLQLAEEYQDQHEALLTLYDLLEARMEAMQGAAEIAVDSPDEDSWRPTLSPAGVNARTQFEGEYPAAQPVSE